MDSDDERMDLIRYRLWLYEHRPDRRGGYKFHPDGPVSGVRYCISCGNGFERAVPHQKRCDNCIRTHWETRVEGELVSRKYLPIGWNGGSINVDDVTWEPPGEDIGPLSRMREKTRARAKKEWEDIKDGKPLRPLRTY